MVYSVYVFIDNRGKPYYVGKTNNMVRRRKEHLEEIRSGNPLPKYKRARALRKKGFKFRMKRVAKFYNENAAFAKERRLIKYYRNKPGIYLTNLTTGGKYEKPTDLKGKPRKATWYKPKPKKKVKKRVLRKKVRRRVAKKKRRR